jgi:hypothetical protein
MEVKSLGHDRGNASTRDVEEISLFFFEIRHGKKVLLIMKPKFKFSSGNRIPISSNLRNTKQSHGTILLGGLPIFGSRSMINERYTLRPLTLMALY